MDDRTVRERRERADQDLEAWRWSRRERDVLFQIKMMDWGIAFFLVCLVGVVLVGIWAVYRMVMG